MSYHKHYIAYLQKEIERLVVERDGYREQIDQLGEYMQEHHAEANWGKTYVSTAIELLKKHDEIERLVSPTFQKTIVTGNGYKIVLKASDSCLWMIREGEEDVLLSDTLKTMKPR